ncbi:MAG TPA: site-specific DNA-methyltransferase [Anaerolineae bacterium]|nr:site-specific DNA-methyltransferase [Anaerolineae bacterium]HUW96013.1 site-specific DNA-methyltransferase [Anaerolineae bacterium]
MTYYEDSDVVLHLGDCVDVMKTLEPVDAIVTDPPYGLEFMGKEWDRLWDARANTEYRRKGFGPGVLAAPVYKAGLAAQEWHYTWAVEALRVLKPGGHMVVFGGTRTFHRLWCAVEDAGFEIRDSVGFLGMLGWIYGQGFPKSLDVSKAIDMDACRKDLTERLGRAPTKAEFKAAWKGWREVVGQACDFAHDGCDRSGEHASRPTQQVPSGDRWHLSITAPATDAARQWQGFGTALKPSWEPILLCRKPIEGTVAHNVLKHGTGALNVDATRIQTDDNLDGGAYSAEGNRNPSSYLLGGDAGEYKHPSGRWPANLCLDEESAKMLDAQSGESRSSDNPRHNADFKSVAKGYEYAHVTHGHNDTGGASRFFYTSKAGPSERGGSKHPTVKPRDLMLWLCKLITPPGGLILDPFIGSGTTAVAARMGGFRCIGIDNNEEYLSHAAERLRLGDEGLCQVNEARKHGAEQRRLW